LEPGSAFDVSTDARYVPGVVPSTECLADVVVRMVPYWYDAIAPALLSGQVVLVAAHGNSLRALIKHLDQMTGEDIAKLEIPTGVPIVYELDKGLRPLQRGGRWLGDPEAIAAAAEAVRRQGQRA
jgi:2,3-bisphosphoglycerate-dependent phosphoglycerate mutase